MKKTNQSSNFWALSARIISPNSCHFWNNKTVFLQILYHSSTSRDIIPLYFLDEICILLTKGAYPGTNVVKFHVSSQKSEMLHFDGLLLSKSCKVSAKEVQNSYLSWHCFKYEFSANHSKVWKFYFYFYSYLSWHWTVMQNLNKPWPQRKVNFH